MSVGDTHAGTDARYGGTVGWYGVAAAVQRKVYEARGQVEGAQGDWYQPALGPYPLATTRPVLT